MADGSDVNGGRKAAFAPFVSAETRLLILGSLPGDASLAAQRYYAHPANRFWHLVGAIMGREGFAALDYDARVAALAAAGIGLWDVIATAERKGSLDTAIRRAEPAPLADLVARLPALRAVAFNGATAARIGRRLLAGATTRLVDLPSSSPAHAAMPYAEKLRRWRTLEEFLA